ncbi:unnamed protein product [Spirodela intermedia]|uniref:Peptidase A1 domain-containing protein n=1 Tax=Spirodela intermedia TaxID=51605 RepID=A0A7I8KI69_SPIIN|nr:unnamed protein product [Spirodela intermedia]
MAPPLRPSRRRLLTLLFPFLILLLHGGAVVVVARGLECHTVILSPMSKQPPPLGPPEEEDDGPSWSVDSEDLSTVPFRDLGPDSFRLRLHHWDSLLAAANSTPEALFRLRLERDSARVSALEDLAGRPSRRRDNVTKARSGGLSGVVVSGLALGSGEYFTRIGIGTPATSAYMVLDTGSDVVWIQCAPCRRCYSQSDPIFDPARSRSYAAVPCGSPLCRGLDAAGCDTRRSSCLYQVSYGDGSVTAGDFSTETVTFSGGARVAGVPFGCGHDNTGLFVAAAGLLGLGRGRLSFPSQAGRRVGRRFSYCLVDRTSAAAALPTRRPRSSTVIFGPAAVPSSTGVAFTPMVANPRLDTFYYVELVGISVGGARVPGVLAADLRLDPATGKGGVIVDSGTSVTRLARPAYTALRDAFRAGTAGLKPAASFSLFETCYDLSGMTEVKVPKVVMHFRGAGGRAAVADLALPAENYLIPVATNAVFCFAFAGTDSGISIIGNIQQQGFRVVFDGAGSRVGFAPGAC